MLEIYTDGAYSSARNQGGIGLVFLLDNNLLQKYSYPYKNTTNNKMEMMAVMTALSALKEKKYGNITIYTDSMYVIGCATKGWKRKKNTNLWIQFDKLLEAVQKNNNVSFEHVKGHAENKWNNLCDKLAVEASHLII